MPRGKKIIHSTNDASDINKDYHVDHALVGDAALVLDALIAEVGRQRKSTGGKALAALKDEIAAAKTAWKAEWKKHFESDEVPINQYRVLDELLKHVDRDNTIVTHDSGSPRDLPDAEGLQAVALENLEGDGEQLVSPVRAHVAHGCGVLSSIPHAWP